MKLKLPYLLMGLLATNLISCQNETEVPSLNAEAFDAISEESYRHHVKTLSADEFMGRQPFTKGDTMTVNYISEQFQELGLEPGNNDSYFQEVPLVEISSRPVDKKWTLSQAENKITLDYLNDFVIRTNRLQEEVKIEDTEFVFAGFGIVAPEYDWNDYEGLDAKGKTVVVMINDPGFYDKSLFKGDTMTYYGRWTYKFEEAARQGATGVLIIHDTAGASYGWDVVKNGWNAPQLTLQSADNGMSLAEYEGWLTAESTQKLFELAGHDLSLLETAKAPGFKPVPLNVKAEVNLQNTFRKSTSNNVIGMIKGTKRPDEVIVYTAHWDHLGVGTPVNGDAIFNGAIDNATGVAALFEIAKGFKAASVAPERSIVFLAVTAEEKGLLGSQYYAENPIFPINKTVANINIDSYSPFPKTKDIAVIGLGQSDIDDYVVKAAEKQNRIVIPGGNPSAGSFFRSDHFNFVKQGVPALYAGSGNQYIDADSAILADLRSKYSGIYHTVHDEYADDWIVESAIEEMKLLLDVGYTLSMETTFPGWKTGSEFKEIGDKRLQNKN